MSAFGWAFVVALPVLIIGGLLLWAKFGATGGDNT